MSTYIAFMLTLYRNSIRMSPKSRMTIIQIMGKCVDYDVGNFQYRINNFSNALISMCDLWNRLIAHDICKRKARQIEENARPSISETSTSRDSISIARSSPMNCARCIMNSRLSRTVVVGFNSLLASRTGGLDKHQVKRANHPMNFFLFLVVKKALIFHSNHGASVLWIDPRIVKSLKSAA